MTTAPVLLVSVLLHNKYTQPQHLYCYTINILSASYKNDVAHHELHDCATGSFSFELVAGLSPPVVKDGHGRWISVSYTSLLTHKQDKTL